MLLRNLGSSLVLFQTLACAREVASVSPFESEVDHIAAEPPTGRLAVDGRQLAWAEYGEPTGSPVFYFGGGDSSRLEGISLADAARSMRARIIAPDRPGFGDSDSAPGRRLVDWPRDVAAIADHLGIQNFSVIGLSGGGPHALVTAWALPDRVDRLVVVASAPLPALEMEGKDVALPFRMISGLTRYAPWAMRFVLKDQMKMASTSPSKLLKRTQGGVEAPDASWLSEDRGGALFAASMRLAYRNGVEGSLAEHRLYRTDWGFSLSEIRTPASFFIGNQDALASRIVNEKMAALVPKASLVIVADEGHLSLIPNQAHTVLKAALP